MTSSREQQLEDRIAELEHELGARPAFSMRRLLGCTGWPKVCDVLLGLLLARDLVTREGAYTVMYGARAESEQPNIKILDVMVVRIRQRLRPHNISIETEWGVGYYITPDNKAKLRALIEQLTIAPLPPKPWTPPAPRRSFELVTKARKLEALERRRGWAKDRKI